MGKKFVKINGKSYMMDTDTSDLEEAVVEGEPSEEINEGTPKEEGVSEEKIDEAAEKVAKSLGIDKLFSKMNEIEAKMNSSEKSEVAKKMSSLLDLGNLMKKGVDKMTAKEKIVGFYQAMMQSNHEVLKALSEGKLQHCSL